MTNKNFIELCKKRGYVHQVTNLSDLANAKKIVAYIGFDCTASSLHVGSLMQIMILRLLQKTGHKPIVLIGSGTSKIGDPSFKDEARKMLTQQEIEENSMGIKNSLAKFLVFGDRENDAIMVDNSAWLNDINYLDFLRDFGRHFSVNRMLSFDSVKLRLDREQSLSFLEFNYMILQAYDFVQLHKKYNCNLQIGGSDQWGNIINGVELNRRLGGAEIFGLTTPLLTTSSGAKMGKTVNGAVWLNADMLSSYDYYQFWRNTEDEDVIRFLNLYTDLDDAEIEKLSKLEGSAINEAKKILAFEATKLCHGEDAAQEAMATATAVFEQGLFAQGLENFYLAKDVLQNGIKATDLLYNAKLVQSMGEAKRLIRNKGASINNLQIDSESRMVSIKDLRDTGDILLSIGKKKHLLVKMN